MDRHLLLRRLGLSLSAIALVAATTACGPGDDAPAADGAAVTPADTDSGSSGETLPACSDLFVEGRGTQETLDAVPTDAQGFQVCSDGQITNQFATMTSQCVNDPSREILYNPFGYGFADGTWELVPENTPLGTGLPVC